MNRLTMKAPWNNEDYDTNGAVSNQKEKEQKLWDCVFKLGLLEDCLEELENNDNLALMIVDGKLILVDIEKDFEVVKTLL